MIACSAEGDINVVLNTPHGSGGQFSRSRTLIGLLQIERYSVQIEPLQAYNRWPRVSPCKPDYHVAFTARFERVPLSVSLWIMTAMIMVASAIPVSTGGIPPRFPRP